MNAIGFVELNSIAKGYETADAALKTSFMPRRMPREVLFPVQRVYLGGRHGLKNGCFCGRRKYS